MLSEFCLEITSRKFSSFHIFHFPTTCNEAVPMYVVNNGNLESHKKSTEKYSLAFGVGILIKIIYLYIN